jgi:hypothetical protein
MSYTVTYNPPKPIRGAAPKLVINESTPTEAWALVQQINGSDVNTEIKDPSGRIISLQELRDRAAKEAIYTPMMPESGNPWAR